MRRWLALENGPPPEKRLPEITRALQNMNKLFAIIIILRLLITQKEKLYPEVQIQIVDAHIHEINGKNHLTVATLNIN